MDFSGEISAPGALTELRAAICPPLALNANVNIQTMQWK